MGKSSCTLAHVCTYLVEQLVRDIASKDRDVEVAYSAICTVTKVSICWHCALMLQCI